MTRKTDGREENYEAAATNLTTGNKTITSKKGLVATNDAASSSCAAWENVLKNIVGDISRLSVSLVFQFNTELFRLITAPSGGTFANFCWQK